MRALQPKLQDVQQHYRGAAFSVKWQLDGGPPPDRRATLNVRLQLSDIDPPVTLIDGMRITFEDKR